MRIKYLESAVIGNAEEHTLRNVTFVLGFFIGLLSLTVPKKKGKMFFKILIFNAQFCLALGVLFYLLFP